MSLRDERGFTVAEVLIAAVIVMMGRVPLGEYLRNQGLCYWASALASKRYCGR